MPLVQVFVTFTDEPYISYHYIAQGNGKALQLHSVSLSKEAKKQDVKINTKDFRSFKHLERKNIEYYIAMPPELHRDLR